MDWRESIKRYGIVPKDADLPDIRNLLATEVECEKRGSARIEDLAYLCCAQLFSRGQLEDVLRIWDAKSSGMDLGTMIDGEMLVGAGIEETKRYLKSINTAEARAALSFIRNNQSGDGCLVEFSFEKKMEDYRAYFGIPQ